MISPLAFQLVLRDAASVEQNTAALGQHRVEIEFKKAKLDKQMSQKFASCAAFSTRFHTEPCTSNFDLQKDAALCSCQHLSYYTLVEDMSYSANTGTPAYKDLPFLIATIYLFIFALFGGCTLVISRENFFLSQIRNAQVVVGKISHSSTYTLNALAFFRQDMVLN